eukprot:1158184-Pelagomonas_calceolata.AAC.9
MLMPKDSEVAKVLKLRGKRGGVCGGGRRWFTTGWLPVLVISCHIFGAVIAQTRALCSIGCQFPPCSSPHHQTFFLSLPDLSSSLTCCCGMQGACHSLSYVRTQEALRCPVCRSSPSPVQTPFPGK